MPIKLLVGVIILSLFVSWKAYAQPILCDASLDLGNDASAYIARANACLELDGRNPAQALADADRAVQLAPDLAEAYGARAWAHLWQRSFGQAIANATVAITLEPDNPQWYRARSFYMLQVDDVEGAVLDLDQAIALTPDEISLYLFRSRHLEQLGRVDEAISTLQDALLIAPDDSDLLFRLGGIYFSTRQDQLARETYQRYVETATVMSPVVNAHLLILERRMSN